MNFLFILISMMPFSSDIYKNKTGAEIIYKFLVSKKIKYVSGFSGGANLPLLNTFYGSKIKFITTAHEQGAGHLMESYGQLKKCGVIVTTSGPGVTNLITPLYNALTDSNPLLVFTGQVATKSIGTDAFQECPAINLTNYCTKWSYRVDKIDELPVVLEKAYDLATGKLDNRKGPVHIDIPKDVQVTHYLPSNGVTETTNDPDLMNNDVSFQDTNLLVEINKLVASAEKPIFYLGKGCLKYIYMIKLAEKLKIPVTTTLHGLGCINENNDLALKMVGMHGSFTANNAIQQADLIIGIGVRFDDRTTGNLDTYAINARKNYGIIHVDIDSNRLEKVKKIVNPTHSLCLDSNNFLTNLNTLTISTNVLEKRQEWINMLINMKKNNNFHIPVSNDLYIQHVLTCLNKKLSKHKHYIFTTGVGNHQMMTAQFINWNSKRKLITSGSLGVMGVGLPFAMGAKLALPKHTVICIDGDGSFNMSFNELKTIVQYNIPIKIFVMNDSRQQMVYVWQKLFCNEHFIATENNNPNYSEFEKAFNIKTLECSEHYDLEDKITFALNYPKPILVNFIVKPDICTPLVSPGKSLDTMILKHDVVSNLDKSTIPS
jgi:acetolactate synthase-1/2/3 large subunit